MAILTAYYQYDIDAFDLNAYIENFESHILERDVNNPWEDNYTVFADSIDIAIELLGSGFGYGGNADMIKGNVEGLSEWFWGGFDVEWVEIYNLTDAKEVSSLEFYDAFRTNKTGDDYGILKTMLSGGDRFLLSADDDNAHGYAGNDKMFGYDGRDTLNGGDGNDKLYGGADRDVLKGGDGKDKLYGGDDRDVLRGGDGNDVIRGGQGRDKELGGEGADRFVFKTGDEKSIIKDFDAKSDAHDVIDLRKLDAIRSWSDLTKNHMEKDGAHVRIDAGDGDIIVIRDVNLSALDKGDFLF